MSWKRMAGKKKSTMDPRLRKAIEDSLERNKEAMDELAKL